MIKTIPTNFVITNGVFQKVNREDIDFILNIATKYFEVSRFVSFRPDSKFVIVEDGDENELCKISIQIKEMVWVIHDKHKDHSVVTIMLASEY